MPTDQSTIVDEAKLQAFMGKMVGDMGAAMSGALVLIGDRLGLYKALAEGGPVTSDELASARARRSGTSASGWPPRRPRATSTTIRRRAGSP